jgi:DNA polymerase
MNLKEIKNLVNKCQKCDLHKTKINYVFGEGNEEAKIVFIGEAPGANEDKQGRPFVGRAGGILDELLASIDLSRGDIFICNILKCRPPQNRNPTPNEINLCTQYLDAQINVLNPKVICTLGNFATQYMMKKYGLPVEGISKLHGKIFNVTTINENIKLIPLYHPAVATYNPETKATLIKDMKLIENELKGFDE